MACGYGNGRVDLDEIVWDFETDDPDLRPTFTYDPALGFGEEVTYRVTLQVEDVTGVHSLAPEAGWAYVSGAIAVLR